MADAIPLPAEGERWLPVVGYEGLYEVSDYGRVRRVSTGKVLRFGMSAGQGKPTRKGYRTVALYRNARQRRFKVHHLVAVAFIGLRPPGLECNHKDGNRLNNHACNLEWVTQPVNRDHAVRMGLTPTIYFGEQHHRAKITAEDAARIRQLRGALSQSQIARLFGISQTRVSQIQRGKGWQQ